jgi:hypothetical protein
MGTTQATGDAAQGAAGIHYFLDFFLRCALTVGMGVAWTEHNAKKAKTLI